MAKAAVTGIGLFEAANSICRKAIWAFVLLAGGAVQAQSGDVIQLAPRQAAPVEVAEGEFGVARTGFDYRAFETRLEALWFQRKTYLANGRSDDAARQADKIASFVGEEGIARLPNLSGALLTEAKRFIDQGEYENAEASLSLALRVDPDRPRIHLARAHFFLKSGRGIGRSAAEIGLAVKTGFAESIRDLSLINRFGLVVVVAFAAVLAIFSLLMLWRYQRLFRFQIQEWLEGPLPPTVAWAMGWGALFLPLVIWFGAGWLALYWLVVLFPFMRRGERTTAVSLILTTALLVPAYNMAVAIYSMTADPQVRTTIASAERSYDPNRILTLRRLVDASPEDPVYRFLLAGLYKDGRYYEDAFNEYREALKLNPDMHQAYINVGNIFYTTGNHNEAVANYLRAVENHPGSVLAYFNMHVAQSESFRFREAEEALARARELDESRVSEILSATRTSGGDRPRIQDATLQITSVWDAALHGRMPREALQGVYHEPQSWLDRWVNPLSAVALFSFFCIGGLLAFGDDNRRARACIRCGTAYMRRKSSEKEAREYCMQCNNLFLQGDGLAPGAKQRKMYEVQRHERIRGLSRRLLSLVFPGSAQFLKGRALLGFLLLLFWVGGWVAFRPGAMVPIEQTLGLDLRLDLLAPGNVPAIYGWNAFACLGLVALAAAWISANTWQRRSS